MAQIVDSVAHKPTWCPGCGNFGILAALNKALAGLRLDPSRVVMVSGIGQSGKLPHYARANTFNSLHGRALPVAAGTKMANPELVVIAIGGDGDGYAEGGNHFVNSVRRNHDITYLVHNNQVYGLTKGQTSPTSDYGFVSKTTPQGADMPLNPLAVALAAGGTFVARGFSAEVDHLASIITMGIQHRGFALIDILQPCVTFNHRNTYQWYKERVYKLEETGYQPHNRLAAFDKAQEWNGKIPLGILFREERPTFEGKFPALKAGALTRRTPDAARLEKLVEEFM